ncbi:hypothetical protein ACHAW6_004687 [Cyclotella cf. meneghiniana]
MWSTSTSTPASMPPPSYFQQPPPSSAPPVAPPSSSTQQGQKHDVFVGNLAFSTTEEQLYAAFSELGRIVKVRMVSDLETGKPRGFAFIEFEDPQAALSAIRNMNDYEINGRRIRVNFSNSSHLETLAGQLGMDLSAGKREEIEESAGGLVVGGKVVPGNLIGTPAGAVQAGVPPPAVGAAGSKAVAAALKAWNKGEMYDVVAKLKEIADANPEEARKLLTQHPQLPEAILYCMSELDMIKTPVATSSMSIPLPTPDINIAKPSDPRARVAITAPPTQPPPPLPAPTTLPSDPRARPADPRARDPRAGPPVVAPNFPPPPMMQPPPQMVPLQQPPLPGVAGLDPNLVQQVMALTPAQIAQLPLDKQQSILALRQQITGSLK